MSKVDHLDELEKAYEIAYEFDSAVMAEPWIEGRELTVPILFDQALPVIEIRATEKFYDYQAKYFTNDTQYICPAELSLEKTTQIQKLALNAFQAIGCKQLARVDFLEDKKGNHYVIEINTIPGFTDHSLVPMAAKAVGIEFDQLVMMLLNSATCFCSKGRIGGTC